MKMTTVHTLIVVALVRQWCISQFDVKNAFLEIFKKKFMWSPFLMFLMILGMFTTSGRHYMVSNKHLVLDLRKFLL